MENSTTHPRIAAVRPQSVQPALKKSTFIIILAVFGGFSLLAGLISFASAIVLSSNAAMPELATRMFSDAAFDLILGALLVASSQALVKGKAQAIWLFGSSILLESLYNLMMGYPLNYVFIGLGLLVLWQMLKFKSEWGVS